MLECNLESSILKFIENEYLQYHEMICVHTTTLFLGDNITLIVLPSKSGHFRYTSGYNIVTI